MTFNARLPIPKGALFYVSTGEYSDYTVQGVFRAIEEIDTETLIEQWLIEHPAQRESYSFDEAAFLAKHINLFEQLDSWEWHMSSYSNTSHSWLSHNEVAP